MGARLEVSEDSAEEWDLTMWEGAKDLSLRWDLLLLLKVRN